MAVVGAHMLFHTSEPEALRRVLGEVLGGPQVDAGGGWPIFALPPSEIAVHPGEAAVHEITFMCDDLAATVADLEAAGVTVEGPPRQEAWGLVVTAVLPGGVRTLVYEPRHPTAI